MFPLNGWKRIWMLSEHKSFLQPRGKYIGKRKHIEKMNRIAYAKLFTNKSLSFWIYLWWICLHSFLSFFFLFLEFHIKLLGSHPFNHSSFPSKFFCVSSHTSSQIYDPFKKCYIQLGFLIPLPKEIEALLKFSLG